MCKKPKCKPACPVNVDIPGFLALIRERQFLEAARKIKEDNALPAVCGRVCPQEEQCEKTCVTGIKHEPVAIGRLERFAADYERRSGAVTIPQLPPKTGKRIVVVGAGPAGLTVAGDLILKGHEITVFEALQEPGGVLMYGIPEFRLPKEIVRAEVDYLTKLGVRFVMDYVVGRNSTISELLNEEGYHAVFIGTGAGLPSFMEVPGENLIGVYSANEYLTRANLMKAYLFPEYDTPPISRRRVAVIGGGNVAMDSARTALRLGGDVTVVYRRAHEQMPARIEEIHHAEQEGIKFKLLTAPTRVIGDARHRVVAMECIQMELGEPDSSGRRRPVPLKGSEFIMEIDTVIVAIGNKPNPVGAANDAGVERHQVGHGGHRSRRPWRRRSRVSSRAAISSPAPPPSSSRWGRDGLRPDRSTPMFVASRCRRRRRRRRNEYRRTDPASRACPQGGPRGCYPQTAGTRVEDGTGDDRHLLPRATRAAGRFAATRLAAVRIVSAMR